MSTALTVSLTSDTCIRFGEVVDHDELRELAPRQQGEDVGEAYTLRQFVDEVFFPMHKVKLPMFGRDNGKVNGTELSKLTRDMGFSVGKREVPYFDKRIGGFVADWVNLYPYAVLSEWIKQKTHGEYEMGDA